MTLPVIIPVSVQMRRDWDAALEAEAALDEYRRELATLIALDADRLIQTEKKPGVNPALNSNQQPMKKGKASCQL